MSKLNPQKASAYVGPGVLRKGGKITPVPNGPLVKKKGPFKGSTLKNGGRVIKKAQEGTTLDNIKEQNRLRQNLTDFRKKVGSTPLTPQLRREKDSLTGLLKNFSTNQRVQATGLTPAQLAANDAQAQKEAARKPDVVDESCQKRGLPTTGGGCSGSARANAKRLKKERNRKNGGPIKKAQDGEYITQEEQKWNGKNMRGYTATKKVNTKNGPRYYQSKSPDLDFARSTVDFKINANPADSIPKAKLSPRALEVMNQKNGGKVKKAKSGAMIKRADGSMSKRGLWDNLRSKAAQNKKTGAKPKSPTKAMLTQEKKIKAKSKK